MGDKQEHIKTQDFKTPYGELVLASFKNKLCLCDWKYRKMRRVIDQRIKDCLEADFVEDDSQTIEATKKQLTEYFNGEREEFDLPLILIGTDFQKMVWYKLLQIPYGTTLTYAQLSQKLRNRKAIRAVASANGANAISIIIPCHRIIGSDGRLVGYAGGLQAKKKLLKLENVLINNQLSLF